MYARKIKELGEVKSYTAYDGAPFCETTTDGWVTFLDLTAPQFGIPCYDWIISLEVGEHIPKQFENIFVDNLVRHAREGIILSWAKIGQGGHSHINNKAEKDVIEMMSKRGFTINRAEDEHLRKISSASWLKGNIRVYRRKEVSFFDPDMC